MERRLSVRKNLYVTVKLTVGGKSYSAFIEDVSMEGVGLTILLASEEMVAGIVVGTILELKFHTETSDEITLQCVIKRVDTTLEKKIGIIYFIGVEVIDPPIEYNMFVSTL